METWIQNYTAVGGSLYLTAAVALLPIIFFFVALTVLKLKGYQAGLYTLLIALGVAVLGFGMPCGHGGFFRAVRLCLRFVADCMDYRYCRVPV